MRVLVCGSRTFKDSRPICAVLDGIRMGMGGGGDLMVIEGGARGADFIAGGWADYWDHGHEVYPADWDHYGRSAGIKRNLAMLATNPDLVVAFVDKPLAESKGTNHTVTEARKRGIETWVVEV